MLSAPDFIEKQLIVISAEHVKNLSLRNDNLLIKDENNKIINQISCFKIFCIFIIGEYTISSKLIDRLMKYQICLFCLWYNFKPKCMIWVPLAWNYILREKQYNNPHELNISKLIIENKVSNQISLLKDIREKSDMLKSNIKTMKELQEKISSISSDDSLRWIEWNVSKLFFQHYFQEQKRYKRMPRTRWDILNFLLDIWYSFLYNFVEANLCLYWFDIYKWVYHKLFYERKSLVCDLVEPFRCIIDHKIKNMYGLSQINEKDFKFRNWEYQIEREKQKPYINHFLAEILKYKMEIFKYIKDYYRRMMDPERIFPSFSLEKNK